MRSRTWLALSLLGLASVLACNSGEIDESNEAVSYDEGEPLGEGACADICGTAECGSCPVAPMVDGGGFMIDATEVSNGQYAALLEVELDAALLPPGCEWKSSFTPEGWTDLLPPELPVVGIDWCDAAVFCAWAGKRLCGAVDGGPADWTVAEDLENDAWYRACSNAGVNTFPYGTAYEPERCNGKDAGQGALSAVGSLAECEGGVAGLFDMSGNVWEWSDSCEDLGGDARTQCRRRGGSHYSDPDNLRCGVNSKRARGERDNGVGFRCCSI
ncbi:MAG: formylglycine-generating enzyme family protein [Enhygromyxa sp.]